MVSFRRSDAKAFTLVELLVVVAIIALLISLLVPSLADAKARSITLKCAANMRALDQGFHIYATQSEDRLPPAANHWANGSYGDQTIWAQYLLGENVLPVGGVSQPYNSNFWVSNNGQDIFNGLPKLFTCPGELRDFSGQWFDGWSYQAGVRILGLGDDSSPDGSPTRLAKIEQSGDRVVLLAEGYYAVQNWYPFFTSPNGHYDAAWDNFNGGWDNSGFGWDVRHGHEMNVAYADGHVAPLRYTGIKAEVWPSAWLDMTKLQDSSTIIWRRDQIR